MLNCELLVVRKEIQTDFETSTTTTSTRELIHFLLNLKSSIEYDKID
jgi:hypothetical protein